MCPDDPSLIRLLNGDAPPPRLHAWQAHVEQCSDCAARLAVLRRTWQELGAWEVDPPPMQRDLSAAVLGAVAQEDRQALPWARWARVAAAVVLASGIGWLAGRYTPVRASTTAQLMVANGDEDPSATLGLGELGSGLDLLESLFASAEEFDSESAPFDMEERS